MKKYISIALVLALAASVLTGCGCTNQNVSDNPGGMVTSPTTVAPTTHPMPTMTTPPEQTTRPATTPTTQATRPTETIIPGIPGDSTPTDMTDETGTATDGTGTGRMMPRRVR